jgi:hypothetical protein
MIINELQSSLSFNFAESVWSNVIKYDSETDTPQNDYERIRNAIEETRAVDFIGIYKQRELTFIEVKNLKFYRIESKDRLSDTETGTEKLDFEVAKKVRDTFAGIVGGIRYSANENDCWQNYWQFIGNKKKDIRVILWLEQDRPDDRQKKPRQLTLNKKLQNRLIWLTKNVRVFNIDNHDYGNDLIVTNLPRKRE